MPGTGCSNVGAQQQAGSLWLTCTGRSLCVPGTGCSNVGPQQQAGSLWLTCTGRSLWVPGTGCSNVGAQQQAGSLWLTACELRRLPANLDEAAGGPVHVLRRLPGQPLHGV